METIVELIARVRDYDQHTSDSDIDRLCDEIERLRAVAIDAIRGFEHEAKEQRAAGFLGNAMHMESEAKRIRNSLDMD